jgi:hypothetical protein
MRGEISGSLLQERFPMPLVWVIPVKIVKKSTRKNDTEKQHQGVGTEKCKGFSHGVRGRTEKF